MTEPRVDIELSDMAAGVGVSLRKLMAGIQNGRFSEYVRKDDLVRGDKGDPLFFRVEQSRAYSIFGRNLDSVTKDMSTVEEMSREESTATRDNPPSAETGEAFSVEPSAVSPQGRGHKTRENEGDEEGTGFLQFAGVIGAMFGVAYLLKQAGQELSRAERERIYMEGYNGYLKGVNQNPYHLESEAAKVYKQGWTEARKEAARRMMEANQVAPLPN